MESLVVAVCACTFPTKAVLRCYHASCDKDIPEVWEFQMLPGRGVRAVLDGKEILAGNLEMLAANNIAVDQQKCVCAKEYLERGCTVIYLALDGILTGFICLADTLRTDAKDMIADAPALKKACVGIAMGGIGSDIAVDAADIVLVNDEIREIPHLLRLARRMMLVIKCNLTFSMALNFLAIILAVTGRLDPVVGALVHNAGSVFVIINSAFLLIL